MSKSKPLKLPKRIGGIKVPKFLREPGTIKGVLDSPVGRAVLAEALIAAAAALKNYKPVTDMIDGAGEAVANAGSDAATAAKDTVQSAASGLADVAAGVIRQIVPTASGDESGADKPAKRAKTKPDRRDENPSRH